MSICGEFKEVLREFRWVDGNQRCTVKKPDGSLCGHLYTQHVSQQAATRVRIDISEEVANTVCLPFPAECLSDVSRAVHALRSPLLAKLPVDRLVSPGSGLLDDSVFQQSGNGGEAKVFVDRFVAFEDRCAELRVGMSEESVLACVTEVTGMMWRRLASLVNMDPVFDVLYNKKDASGATEGDGRPDETDYLDDFMVSKSEHKDRDIEIAISELTSKLSGYNIVEYGLKIVCLPVIAAAGTNIEFGVVDVRTKTYHRVDRCDVSQPKRRVLAFVRMLNIFRLINTMAPHIPKHPTPLFKSERNVILYDTHAIKKQSLSHTCPDELYDVLRRGEVPDAVRVEKRRHDIKITPKGYRIPDRGEGLSEEDLRAAVIATLHCLDYLHQKGFVHRDLRWANIIRRLTYRPDNSVESCSFLVIDFEFAYYDGGEMMIQDYIHKDIVGYGEAYYARHDMKLVAKLVKSWARSNCNVLSATGNDFVDAVSRDVAPMGAGEALTHPWLS